MVSQFSFKMRYYKHMFENFWIFEDFPQYHDIANIKNFAEPIRYVVGASSKYPHTKYEVNISIQY